MIDQRTAPYAALLLRVTLGIAFLAHGPYLKAYVFTMPNAVGYFESLGLPGALAWVVMLAEAIAGIMLVLGIQARAAALAMVPILLGAVWTHSAAGWVFTNPNGGWEYPAVWTILLIVQALLGDGAFALNPSQRLPFNRAPELAPR